MARPRVTVSSNTHKLAKLWARRKGIRIGDVLDEAIKVYLHPYIVSEQEHQDALNIARQREEAEWNE